MEINKNDEIYNLKKVQPCRVITISIDKFLIDFNRTAFLHSIVALDHDVKCLFRVSTAILNFPGDLKERGDPEIFTHQND